MKAVPIVAALASMLLVQGCVTSSSTRNGFPNADINSFEARARAAIAGMPVALYTFAPLPKGHPWYAGLREQNQRIAGSPRNFRVYFYRKDGKAMLDLSFEDPDGYFPGRYVVFELESGKLVDLAKPTPGGVIGGKFIWEALPAQEVVEKWEREHHKTEQSPAGDVLRAAPEE